MNNLKSNCIPEICFLISFDIVNISPGIHKKSRIKSVERLINTRSIVNKPTLCIFTALHIC